MQRAGKAADSGVVHQDVDAAHLRSTRAASASTDARSVTSHSATSASPACLDDGRRRAFESGPAGVRRGR